MYIAIAFPTLNAGPQEELPQAPQGELPQAPQGHVPDGSTMQAGRCPGGAARGAREHAKPQCHWDLGAVSLASALPAHAWTTRKQMGLPGELFIHFITVKAFKYQDE